MRPEPKAKWFEAGEELTYWALDEKASELANALVRKGKGGKPTMLKALWREW